MGYVPVELHHHGCDRARAPYLDYDTLGLVEGAVESLVCSRGSGQGDAGAALSCLASLIAEAQSQLPDAVAQARCHDYTWEEIASRLATTARTVRRRYGAYARWRASLACGAE
jgi:DNA-directed RNA polymerase specialized sigma24 family protein